MDITVTFVNLDTDQVGNAGKNFEASLIIQEELLQMTVNLASYIIDTLYIADGENGLYYHDGVGSYTNADQEAGDNSYRYAGANPNNYICFGSDWANLITDATWNVGGMTYSQTNTVKQAYAEEVGNNTVTENFQVGLMYVSDYGYAASPENWSLPLYNLDNDTNRNNNWMYMGLTEWTLTKRSEDTIYVFRISDSGNVDVNGVSIFRAARPVFYLDSSVEIDMKNLGTQTDPYRIVL